MTTDKCLINSKEWWSWKYRWNLRSDRIDLLTLDKISLICSLKVDFESKTNPKCFWARQRLKELLLNVIDGWGTGFKFQYRLLLELASLGQDKSPFTYFCAVTIKLRGTYSDIMNNRKNRRVISKEFAIWRQATRLVIYINQEQKRFQNRSLRSTWSDSFQKRVLTI